jgi:hypothetical protein
MTMVRAQAADMTWVLMYSHFPSFNRAYFVETGELTNNTAMVRARRTRRAGRARASS